VTRARLAPAAALLLALAAPLGADDGRAGELAVLSYNVHGLPAWITGDDTLARQAAIAPLLEPFDVVGLQEDFMAEGHARLLEASSHPVRHRFADALDGRVYGSGLTTLARPAGRLVHTEHFERFHGRIASGADGLASKGFLVVRLELAPGVELDVYDAHLDAGGGDGDAEVRASQVAQLERAMRTVSAGRAVVFLGDTNLGRGERDRATLAGWLEASGLRCACHAARAECCERIDRVLYRAGAGLDLEAAGWELAPGFTDAAGRGLSDHAPLAVRLLWTRAPL